MLLDFAMLVFALIVLVKASEITINNAVKISRISGVNEIVIGFILIALATSIPELSIAVISSLQGANAVSFGNLIGANITNLTLTFAIMAFYGIKFKLKGVVEIDKAIILTTIVALFLMLIGQAGLIFGVFAISLFYLFAKFVFKVEMDGQQNHLNEIETVEIVKSVVLVIIAIIAIIASANVVVDAAIAVAKDLGIAETIIGATILGLGTTLPELTVNIAAIKKKRYSLAIGDSIGSIVTNFTVVLGVAAILSPITVTAESFMLLGTLIFVSLAFMFIAYRTRFGLTEGAVLLLLYAAYISVAIFI